MAWTYDSAVIGMYARYYSDQIRHAANGGQYNEEFCATIESYLGLPSERERDLFRAKTLYYYKTRPEDYGPLFSAIHRYLRETERREIKYLLIRRSNLPQSCEKSVYKKDAEDFANAVIAEYPSLRFINSLEFGRLVALWEDAIQEFDQELVDFYMAPELIVEVRPKRIVRGTVDPQVLAKKFDCTVYQKISD